MQQLESNGLTMIDFFCGAGIGAVGFKQAGFQIIDALDNKEYAVKTYNKNIGMHARIADVRHMSIHDVSYADVYVGGFPCTPFSFGGKGDGITDKLNGDLGYHFYRLVRDKQPKAFIVENVKGLISQKHRGFFDELLNNFRAAGYEVSWKLINCYEHGVPQLRERVFIVGIREDLGLTYEFPEPVPESDRKVLRDAIGDLQGSCCVSNHAKYYDGGFSPRYLSRNRQKQWDDPSFTIVASDRQLPLHPEPPNYDIRRMSEYNMPPPRRFTVRECLRIQSVPDWFEFSDEIPLTKQYERCSGIPSLIAYKLGSTLARQLHGAILYA